MVNDKLGKGYQVNMYARIAVVLLNSYTKKGLEYSALMFRRNLFAMSPSELDEEKVTEARDNLLAFCRSLLTFLRRMTTIEQGDNEEIDCILRETKLAKK